jgi:spore coat protein U-like protein
MRIRGLHGRLRAAIVATALIAGGARAAPQCWMVTLPVAFGTYNPVSATPTDSVGTIYYFCQGGASPVISVSAGSAGSFSPRGMVAMADVLAYNLYADAARTVVWGDGTSGSVTVPGVTSAGLVTTSIYGRIFALQSVSAGNYSDTLIVTINF